MPHSSGGGSHSGGSHSSHSSHSSGGSSSSAGRRVRSTYFPGSRRYVYYHRNTPSYVYADYDITKKRSPLRYLMLLFYLPFLLSFYFMAKESLLPPEKLTADYYTETVIIDSANVLGNTEKLKGSLNAFFDETGISPAVFTVYNEDWQDRYDDLENYAYDLYVNVFPDEKHWLIVYSEPETPDPSFNDWYWEGMQGDDTSGIITEAKAGQFNSAMQRYLTDEQISVSDAVSRAFDEITPEMMHKKNDAGVISMLVIFGGFICVHAFFMVFYDPGKKYRNAVECPESAPSENSHRETCPYCGAEYMSGTTARCPNCEALLGIEDKK